MATAQHTKLWLVAWLTVTCLGVFAQQQPQQCAKPEYSPKKDQHMNCVDYLGRRQGLWKVYNYYGYVLSEVSYKDGKLSGSSTIYYSVTGKVRERANYFDGKKDGEFANFFFNGQTNSEGEFDYGKKVGTWTFYYSSTGETRKSGNYVMGKLDGEWKFYNSKGVLLKTVYYKMGEAVKTELPPKSGDPSNTISNPDGVPTPDSK